MFGDQYIIITKNRSDIKKRDKGSGGIAILIKKDVGKVEEIKKKRTDGLLWMKIECEVRTIYIYAQYIWYQKDRQRENKMKQR